MPADEFTAAPRSDLLRHQVPGPLLLAWSWIRPGLRKFSSVSRHHYVGFGPSAGSMIGGHFHVNTFCVDAYADALPSRRPVALAMPFVRCVFAPFRALEFMRRAPPGFEVTDSGAFWIRRLQNEYSLAYIERLWGRCRKTAWPSEVRL